MAWLLRDGEVLASIEVADTRQARRKGLLGRSGIDGVLLLPNTRSIHTLGMSFPIDVAHLDADHVVMRATTMRPMRVGALVPSAKFVIEAEAGSFARWGLQVGDVLEVKGDV